MVQITNLSHLQLRSGLILVIRTCSRIPTAMHLQPIIMEEVINFLFDMSPFFFWGGGRGEGGCACVVFVVLWVQFSFNLL